METTAGLSLTCQIALLIERLVEAGRLFGCIAQGLRLGEFVWKRMQTFQGRFERLAARIEAGTLRPPRQRMAPAGDAERKRAGGRSALPRIFGWMARMVPGAGMVAQALERLLADPEMPALLAAAPQTGRILRPLCQMLGIRPTAELRLRRRPRGRRRGGLPSATHPTSEQKPVDVTKLSSVAYGNLIHPEREPMGWRPPNRIGYARPKPWPK